MIVRILGEGLFDVPEAQMPGVEKCDAELVEALDAGDEDAFETALADLIKAVRGAGRPVSEEELTTSQLVVPHEGSMLSELKALLDDGV